MNDDARFELVWNSYRKQVDENNKTRENITDLQERMNQVCNFLHKIEENKMSEYHGDEDEIQEDQQELYDNKYNDKENEG
jgi:hypothetical protein